MSLWSMFFPTRRQGKPVTGVKNPPAKYGGYPVKKQGQKDPNSKRSNKFGPKKD